jgi:SAM-dependent methyltransferase
MASGAANTKWAAMLARWAIPDELVAGAPEPPYFFDPTVFTAAAEAALARDHDTISDAVARQVLDPGGTVLDVGAGAGTASLRLHPARVVAIDLSGKLLAALRSLAAATGIDAVTIEGRWPDVAPRAPVARVVVCHHVAYNVADLAGFADALSRHASRRVVLELTAVHPMTWMAPYWEAMHGVTQPDRPTADDAVAVLSELGLEIRMQRWRRDIEMIGESGDDGVRRIARRLCLPAARLPELRELLAAVPPPRHREVVTLWWNR